MTTFRWDPADYNRNSTMQLGFARDLMERLTLRGTERVLDIGCGDGKLTAAIAERVPFGSAVGVDSSAEMVRYARQHFPAEQYPNLEFRVADARCLPVANEFEWVVSFAALHWVHQHRPVLAGIQQALKPGGRVLMEFGGKGNGGPLMQVALEVMASERWRDRFADFTFPWTFHSAEAYQQIVQAALLIPERVELVLREAAHQGREGFAGWMRTTWIPFLQQLPQNDWDAFIADVTDQYLAVCPMTADGTIRVPMMRLQVEAVKATKCISAMTAVN